MTWRLAESLRLLRAEVDARWPNRSKDSDGSIGDVSHSARESDHNPDTDGVVKAIDITHDPRSGCDSYALAEALRVSRDSRIKYIISNRRICSFEVDPWQWRPYHGINPHNHHVHISVRPDRAHYDSLDPWNISGATMPAATTMVAVVPPTLRMGDHGDAVEHIQQELNARGLAVRADGKFGVATAAAVKSFQRARGLIVDGVIGPQTWAALNGAKI